MLVGGSMRLAQTMQTCLLTNAMQSLYVRERGSTAIMQK